MSYYGAVVECLSATLVDGSVHYLDGEIDEIVPSHRGSGWIKTRSGTLIALAHIVKIEKAWAPMPLEMVNALAACTSVSG